MILLQEIKYWHGERTILMSMIWYGHTISHFGKRSTQSLGETLYWSSLGKIMLMGLLLVESLYKQKKSPVHCTSETGKIYVWVVHVFNDTRNKSYSFHWKTVEIVAELIKRFIYSSGLSDWKFFILQSSISSPYDLGLAILIHPTPQSTGMLYNPKPILTRHLASSHHLPKLTSSIMLLAFTRLINSMSETRNSVTFT